MKKAGDRLCMHLDDERIEKTLHSFIARKVVRRVKPDTLIIVDPSDMQKPYATQMDFLSKVWDGSKGAVGDNQRTSPFIYKGVVFLWPENHIQ